MREKAGVPIWALIPTSNSNLHAGAKLQRPRILFQQWALGSFRNILATAVVED